MPEHQDDDERVDSRLAAAKRKEREELRDFLERERAAVDRLASVLGRNRTN